MKTKFLSFPLLATIFFLSSCKKDDASPPPPPPALVYTTTTFAGSSQGYADGNSTSAQFNVPAGLAKDASGNLFVADRDNHRIRKISATGVVTTFAGSGIAGLQDGTGTAAKFNQPYGLTIDAAGNLYVADRLNFCVRKITPAGIVTTLAGSTNGYADGTGAAAQFSELYGITADASGNLYVPDFFNQRIRKITPSGVVTTFAGSGSTGFNNGTGTAASFNYPFQITTDASGNLYVSDYYNHSIRKITAAGAVATLAGKGTPGADDSTGTSASFRQPGGLTVDGSGNVYVADVYNNKVRKITAAGVVTTIAGGSGPGNFNGTGTAALFDTPLGMCGDFSSNAVYISEFGNHCIRKISIQ